MFLKRLVYAIAFFPCQSALFPLVVLVHPKNNAPLFIKRIFSDRHGKKIGIIRLEMGDIVGPFNKQCAICSFYIQRQMVHVRLREANERFPRNQLVHDVEYRPEHFCKGIVFQ